MRRIKTIIALTLAVLLAFSLAACKKKDGLSAKSTPEEIQEYVKKAADKTAEALKAAGPLFPDFSKLQGGPQEADWTIGINELGGDITASSPYAALLEGSKLHIDAKADPAKLRASIGLDAFSSAANFTGYELYLSPTLLALKAPDFFKGAPYVSINPTTFVADWNGSYFGQMAQIPDLPFSLDSLLNSSVMSAYTYSQGFDFDVSGKITYTYNEADKTVTARLSAGDATEIGRRMIGGVMDMYQGLASSLADSFGGAVSEFEDGLAEVRRTLDKFAITTDINVVYSFDKDGRISSISVSDLAFDIDGMTAAAAYAATVMTTDKGDITAASIYANVADDTGESVEFTATRSYADKELYNASVSFKAPDSVGSASLTGKLTETETEVAFRNGLLTVAGDDGVIVALAIDGAQRKIAEVPEPTKTKSFFDLSMTELAEIMQALSMFQ